MTAMEKVLLRKDIASVIVAVVAGIATVGFLGSVTTPFAELLSPLESTSSEGLIEQIWAAIIAFALQLIALELLLRSVIMVRANLYKKVR